MSADAHRKPSFSTTLAVSALCVLITWTGVFCLAPARALAAPAPPPVELVTPAPALAGWTLAPVRLGDSLRARSGSTARLEGAHNASTGAADPLSQARLQLKQSRQALGVGVLWVLLGPVISGLGVLALSGGAVVGIISIATGGLFMLLGWPILIIGAIGVGKAKRQIRTLERQRVATLTPAAPASLPLVELSW